MKLEDGETTIDNTYFCKMKNKYRELCSDSSFIHCNVMEAPNFRQGVCNK